MHGKVYIIVKDNFSLLRINNNVKNINGYLDRVAIFLVIIP